MLIGKVNSFKYSLPDIGINRKSYSTVAYIQRETFKAICIFQFQKVVLFHQIEKSAFPEEFCHGIVHCYFKMSSIHVLNVYITAETSGLRK